MKSLQVMISKFQTCEAERWKSHGGLSCGPPETSNEFAKAYRQPVRALWKRVGGVLERSAGVLEAFIKMLDPVGGTAALSLTRFASA